ncbi:MAG: ATP-binding protein [Vulcanimicrobiota bacterium]
MTHKSDWTPREQEYFAENLRRLCWTAVAGWGVFGIRNFLCGYPLSTATCALVSLGTISIALASQGRLEQRTRAEVWVHLNIALNALGIATMGLLTGQQDSTTPLTFLTLLPLFAAYQLSVWAALGWGALGALLILLVHASSLWWRVPPEFNPSGWQLALDRVVMLCVVAAFAIHARLVNEQRLRVIRSQAANLELARDQALKASEIKSAFLATMSHEIRTPLHGVLGLAEVLSHSPLSEADQGTVQAIRASGRLLLTIVNDILDLSKLEKGQLQLETIPFSLDQVFESVLELNLAVAHQKGLALWMHIEPDVPQQLQGDPTRLQQILMNLVSNALKFSDRGEVLLSASRQGGRVRLEVQDRGQGIARDDLERLFLPFEQLDSSITRRFGGSGLGLAISQALAQRMGSRIEVDSQLEVGSRFYLSLPVSDELGELDTPLAGRRVCLVGLSQTGERCTASLLLRAGAQLVQDPAHCDWFLCADDQVKIPQGKRTIWLGEGAQPGYAQSLRLPLTIRSLLRPGGPSVWPAASERSLQALVVEDNSVNQKVMLGMLKRLGWEAVLAGNGLEALERLAERAYPLVLMDLQMPLLDGLETTRRIRQRSEWTQPYIIVVTANAFPEVKDSVRQAGADDILTKPLHLEELALSLERVFPV